MEITNGLVYVSTLDIFKTQIYVQRKGAGSLAENITVYQNEHNLVID